MLSTDKNQVAVWAGDQEGRAVVYNPWGSLVEEHGESIIELATGWDMNVRSPWRGILPKIVFMGFNGKAISKLYITTTRVVLIREIDPWRETKGEMTPLGMPNAVATQVELRKKKQAGIRQFCEVRPQRLRLVSRKRYVKRGCMVDMRLLGRDDTQYAIAYWKTDGKDDKTLALIESQFRR